MADNTSDAGGVGLLAFILGGMVVLVLAVAVFLFLGSGARMPGGDQVNVNLPSGPSAPATPDSGGR